LAGPLTGRAIQAYPPTGPAGRAQGSSAYHAADRAGSA
jgi:hypothetical protein